MSPLAPPGPRGHPLFGSMREIQRDPLDFYSRAARTYGDIVCYRFGPARGYLMSGPDGARQVLQADNDAFNKQNFVTQLLVPFLGQGLITSNGTTWQQQRRLVQPALHRKRVAAFGPLISAATQAMLERWEGAAAQCRPLDIAAEMQRLTLRIVSEALFSHDISPKSDAIGQAFEFINRYLASAAFDPVVALRLRVPALADRRFTQALRLIDGAIYSFIRARRARPDAADDLLAMLLAEGAESGAAPSDRQLRDEIITLLFAGHETSASALSWSWQLLAANPHIADRLHAELDAILHGRPPTIDDLPALPYARMVIEEAMRLYPPAWNINRVALRDQAIGGYRIPARAEVTICVYALHRHPAHWEHPDAFLPERFSAERSKERPAYLYLPFGAGPRFCVGSTLAMTEAQLILATVAQRFAPRLAPGSVVTPEPLITLRPRGLTMVVVER